MCPFTTGYKDRLAKEQQIELKNMLVALISLIQNNLLAIWILSQDMQKGMIE